MVAQANSLHILNLFLIPKWGMVGASIGTLIGYVFMAVVSYYYVKKYVPKIKIEFGYVWKFILAGIVFISVVTLLRQPAQI